MAEPDQDNRQGSLIRKPIKSHHGLITCGGFSISVFGNPIIVNIFLSTLWTSSISRAILQSDSGRMVHIEVSDDCADDFHPHVDRTAEARRRARC